MSEIQSAKQIVSFLWKIILKYYNYVKKKEDWIHQFWKSRLTGWTALMRDKKCLGWKIYTMTLYLLIATFLTNGMQALQYCSTEGCISTYFVYTQLNAKTVLYITVQLRESTISMSKTVPFPTIQFSISEFELQSRYYVPFRANNLGKGMDPLILPAMG